MARPRWALAGLLLALPLAGSGCHDFKYVDVAVRFDPTPAQGQTTGFDSASAFTVNICRVNVSGAATDSFVLPEGSCPNRLNKNDPLNVGTFEYSTFADSGNITFTLQAFQGNVERADCKLG